MLWGLALALETALVAGAPRRDLLPAARRASSRPLAALALLGAGPWLLYATQMWELNRQDRADKDITVGIDHYSVQGGYGLAVVALVTITAIWPQVRRFIGLCVGTCTLYLGVISFVWHPTQGSFNETWSLLCMRWGLAVALVAFRPDAGGESAAAALAPTRFSVTGRREG